MKKKQGYYDWILGLTFGGLCVALLIGAGWGWVWNIVKLANMSFDHITGMLVVRGIGIFIAPIGAVVGWL